MKITPSTLLFNLLLLQYFYKNVNCLLLLMVKRQCLWATLDLDEVVEGEFPIVNDSDHAHSGTNFVYKKIIIRIVKS